MKQIRELSWLDLKGIQQLPHLEIIAEIDWIDKNITNPDYSDKQTNRMRKYRASLENEYRYRKSKGFFTWSIRDMNKARAKDYIYYEYYQDPNTINLDPNPTIINIDRKKKLLR